MALLIASWLVVHQRAAAFALLLGATACLGAGFGLSVPALNTLAAALHPGGGGPVRAGPQRPARPGHGARAGVRCGVQRPGVLDRAAGARRRPAGRADRASACGCRWTPALARLGAAGARPGRPRAGGIPAGFWVFAAFAVLYGFVRDDERQLVAAGCHVAGRSSQAIASLALTALLGRGDRGPGAAGRGPALAAEPGRLPRAAVPARRGVRADRRAALARSGRGSGRVRPGRARLLGAAAAHYQLRAGQAGRPPRRWSRAG